MRGGVLADGLNSILAAVFNSLPNTTFAQNNGVIQLTGVASRVVGYSIAVILMALGVMPKLGALVAVMPPAVLGGMIGGALVGTFLGVLLAYGMAGPFAARLKGVVEEEAKFLEVVRAVLVSHLHGNAPQISVETGRKMAPSEHMPSFQELEQAVQAVQMPH